MQSDATRTPAPRQVTDFIVLDLDRTLLNTDRLMELLCVRLERYGVPNDEVTKSKQAIYASTGQSLSVLEYLGRRHGDDLVEQVVHDLCMMADAGRLDGAALLYDGASEALLRELDRLRVPFAVLTYGKQADQRFKVDLFRHLTGRDETTLLAVVTDEPRKGVWIHAQWSDEPQTNRIRIPAAFTPMQAVIATRVIILDDKLASLRSPDANVVGIHIDNRVPPEKGRHSILSVTEYVRKNGEIADMAQHYDSADRGDIDIMSHKGYNEKI